MKEFLLKLIILTHIFFIIFVVITPFTDSNYFLMLHAMTVPFIVIHWICNDNTCMLTLIERALRKEIYGEKNDENCITCKLVEPVYDFKNNYQAFSTLIYIITLGLWLFSASRVYCRLKTRKISNWRQLFML